MKIPFLAPALTATVVLAWPPISPGQADRCTAEEVEWLVRSFVGAFNVGDRGQLDALWAPESYFQWYSATQATPRRHSVVYARSHLMRHFAARHRRGERLVLRSFQFNGNGGEYGHFDYRLVRRARDLSAGSAVRYVEKGAAWCRGRPKTVGVWSMGSGM